MTDPVNHPSHYIPSDPAYETIKVIEAWNLGYNLGNATKYISRAGKKDPGKTLEDLKKARWYLDREITNLEKANDPLNADIVWPHPTRIRIRTGSPNPGQRAKTDKS